MSAGGSIAVVIVAVFGLAWLSKIVSGSSEWGVGAFVVVLMMFFVSNRTTPAQRHRRTVRGDRLLRMNSKALTR